MPVCPYAAIGDKVAEIIDKARTAAAKRTPRTFFMLDLRGIIFDYKTIAAAKSLPDQREPGYEFKRSYVMGMLCLHTFVDQQTLAVLDHRTCIADVGDRGAWPQKLAFGIRTVEL